MLPQSFANRILRLVSSLLLMGAIACALMSWRSRPAYAVDDPAAERTQYSQGIAAHYNYRFGV